MLDLCIKFMSVYKVLCVNCCFGQNYFTVLTSKMGGSHKIQSAEVPSQRLKELPSGQFHNILSNILHLNLARYLAGLMGAISVDF